MTTTINSNGSKWAGQAPDTIDRLLKVLASHPLDRVFEMYGNFIYPVNEMTRFWGNFLTMSHIFSIDTDEPDIIERLTAAIRKNQQRQDYLSQHDPVKVQAERKLGQRRKFVN